MCCMVIFDKDCSDPWSVWAAVVRVHSSFWANLAVGRNLFASRMLSQGLVPAVVHTVLLYMHSMCQVLAQEIT